MSLEVVAANVSDFDWLKERTGFVPSPNCKAIKAVDRKGIIKGMVAFDHFTENLAQLHFAVDAPIAFRTLIPCGFHYIFEQAKKGVISAVIASNNERSLQMASHLGLVEVGKIWDGHAVGVDLIIMELRKENCRFLTGQRRAA